MQKLNEKFLLKKTNVVSFQVAKTWSFTLMYIKCQLSLDNNSYWVNLKYVDPSIKTNSDSVFRSAHLPRLLFLSPSCLRMCFNMFEQVHTTLRGSGWVHTTYMCSGQDNRGLSRALFVPVYPVLYTEFSIVHPITYHYEKLSKSNQDRALKPGFGVEIHWRYLAESWKIFCDNTIFSLKVAQDAELHFRRN